VLFFFFIKKKKKKKKKKKLVPRSPRPDDVFPSLVQFCPAADRAAHVQEWTADWHARAQRERDRVSVIA
jgi:hypothetical protein